MSKFVHVLTFGGKVEGYFDPIFKICNKLLCSIAPAFASKSFGINTVNRLSKKTIQSVRNLDSNIELFIDSGGYSIITGQINVSEVIKFIESYCTFLVNTEEYYDHIFSLDIPLSLKYDEINTKEKIYQYNKHSLILTRKYIEENNPELWNKLYFVWHFKIKEQYDIWKQLYKELELGRFVKCHAIGGLVSLRKIAKINFSAFITMIYKIITLLSAAFTRLHILGIGNLADRFIILLLSELINNYYPVKIIFTYDSSIILSTLASGRYKTQRIPLYINNELVEFSSYTDIPREVLQLVFNDDKYVSLLLENINSNTGKTDLFIMYPLILLSHLCMDKFLLNIIKSHQIDRAIIDIKTWDRFSNFVNTILKNYVNKYPALLSNMFIASVIESCKYIYVLNKMYMNNKLNDNIEELMYRTIDKINFPMRLR